MNKFNKRQASANKARKVKARVTKKRVGAAKRHQDTVHVSSGKRTGKAAKRRERNQRLQVKTSAKVMAMASKHGFGSMKFRPTASHSVGKPFHSARPLREVTCG